MLQNRVFQNAKWIIGCKIVQSLLQLVIGMISARYLGPTNYGLLSYAASVTAFAVPVMQLGLRSTLVQEFVSRPEQEGRVLGTSLMMSAVSGVACMIGVSCFVLAANPSEQETILVCSLYSISLVFQSLDLIQCWFQAKLLSKYASLVSLCTYLVVSAYKIWLLASGKSVLWFAVSYCVEYAVSGVLMLAAYRKNKGSGLSVSLELAGMLFSKSKHYILASLMVMVFQNTDHVMLKFLAGDEANGFYTAAVTCTSVAGFVYTAILDSARPVILESKGKSREAFERNVTRLYSVMIWLSLAQGACFTVLAEPLVKLLYGGDYLPAVPVLRINVWMLSLGYLGSVRNIWILAEEKHDLLWIINLCGALANIGLNALMIPLWGACGAAAASVLTQFVANVVMGFLIRSIRRNNLLMLRGLNPGCILELLRK